MDKRLKYYDLMEQLHGKIMSGEIRPGEKLPSENELSAEYGVSRQTVRKALQILQNEDTYEHGRGSLLLLLLGDVTAYDAIPKYRGCDNLSFGLYFPAHRAGN